MDRREYALELFSEMMKIRHGPGKKIDNMSRGEMAMMGCLTFKMNGHTPAEISRELEISTAAVANTLNKLEEKGLIERKADAVDRRKVNVYLTEKGRNFSKEREGEMIEDLSKLLSILENEEVEQLITIVRKIGNKANKEGKNDV